MPRQNAVIATVLVAVLACGVAATGQSDGVIEGQVLSATQGDAPIHDAIVTLLSWRGTEGLPPRETRTDEVGRFAFRDLERADHEYQLLVEHQGITYRFGRKAFPPDESALSVPLTVYDATSDEGVLIVERAHMIIDGDAQHLHVQEVHVLTNASTSTYAATGLASGEGAIRFFLPTGAANLEWLGGFSPGSVAISEAGFNIDAPVLPGTVEVTFSYTLPFSSASYTLEKRFPYAVDHLDVFVAVAGVDASAPQLVRGDPIAMQAGHYNRFTGDKLPPGTTVTIEFQRPDSPPVTPVATPGGGPNATVVVVIAAAVVVVVVVLVYPFLRRSRRGRGEAGG